MDKAGKHRSRTFSAAQSREEPMLENTLPPWFEGNRLGNGLIPVAVSFTG